jgi:hypothetical protein
MSLDLPTQTLQQNKQKQPVYPTNTISATIPFYPRNIANPTQPIYPAYFSNVEKGEEGEETQDFLPLRGAEHPGHTLGYKNKNLYILCTALTPIFSCLHLRFTYVLVF